MTVAPPATVLVTGGGGFIGGHLVPLLTEAGYRVRSLDNRYRADPEVLAAQERLGVELVEADVRSRGAMDRAVRGADAVIHLAATAINKSFADPAESLEINLLGTEHTFAAAADAGVRRVVFASSASVYGEPESLPMREDGPLAPQTPYCISKLAGEHLLGFYRRTRGLSGIALRLFNVYGPGQRRDAYYTTVVLSFTERLLAAEPPVIDGDGAQTMDFVHVRDVAAAFAAALTCPADAAVCNVGTGTQTSVAELARILSELVGSGAEPRFRPRDVLVTRRAADVRRAAEVLGWRARIGVKEGLAEVVAEVRGRRDGARGSA